MFLHRGRRAVRTLVCLSALTLTARAVVVRGTVTDPLGKPVANARISLIQGRASVAVTLSDADGTYEIRTADPGRFTLLTTSDTFAPNIGQDFYGARTAVVTQQVVLNPASLTQQVTVTATGLPTPLEQVSSAITLIPQDDLRTRVGVVEELRQSPGVTVVQTGQVGGVTSLFIRGGNSDANRVLIDGIPAEDVGGRFDFGTVSSTGVAGLELHRGPDSAVYGSDAEAGVVAFDTPRGTTIKPVLNYSGDAGTLHTYRNEAAVSGTYGKADYLAAFSRFQTSNALPLDEFHAVTSSADLGYDLTTNTQARFTLRNAVSASGLPNAYDIFNIPAAGKEADQDLYSGLTIENRYNGNLHNLVRYGIARKREQAFQFYPAGNPVVTVVPPYMGSPGYSYTTWYGNAVTLRGANGYTVAGQAALTFSPGATRDDSVSNRDELYYQTDYTFPHHIAVLGSFRYENERGAFIYPNYGENEQIKRTNFEYTLQIQGDLRNRFFYSLGGAVVKNHLFGVAGTPRLGLTYVPFTNDWHHFSGTKFRFNAATGIQEPSLATDFTSLYGQLIRAGNTAAIATYNIRPVTAARSRTYELGLDQNLFGKKLVLRADLFHNQFNHQIEYVSAGTLKQDFGLTGSIPNFYGADLTTQAFRAEGLETEIEYQPRSRVFLRGGYTYLATRVEQAFNDDALLADGQYLNPAFPTIEIGANNPLIGARVFRRPPHTGFFAVGYTGTRFSTALKGSLASRADDSTFQEYNDLNGGNSLLLPNRDLDFGYAKLDLGFNFAATRHVSVFSQLDNLLNQQHIGPIGYPGLPFTLRSGLKIRMGGE